MCSAIAAKRCAVDCLRRLQHQQMQRSDDKSAKARARAHITFEIAVMSISYSSAKRVCRASENNIAENNARWREKIGRSNLYSFFVDRPINRPIKSPIGGLFDPPISNTDKYRPIFWSADKITDRRVYPSLSNTAPESEPLKKVRRPTARLATHLFDNICQFGPDTDISPNCRRKFASFNLKKTNKNYKNKITTRHAIRKSTKN